jgi:hypothetical protein
MNKLMNAITAAAIHQRDAFQAAIDPRTTPTTIDPTKVVIECQGQTNGQ